MWAQLAWLTAGVVIGLRTEGWVRKFVEDNGLADKVLEVQKSRAELKDELLKAWKMRKKTDMDKVLRDLGITVTAKEEDFLKIFNSIKEAAGKVDWSSVRDQAKLRRQRIHDRLKKAEDCCARPGDDCCI